MYEGGALVCKISALVRRYQRALLLSFCPVIIQGEVSIYNPEKGSHQSLTMLEP